jgi:hypothetical protein
MYSKAKIGNDRREGRKDHGRERQMSSFYLMTTEYFVLTSEAQTMPGASSVAPGLALILPVALNSTAYHGR